ncbi:hypothetical protein PCK2_000008 [Pneumocystis canis]|nr:hypothetical protein PCK2_000008 [Pneumocystis canis]
MPLSNEDKRADASISASALAPALAPSPNDLSRVWRLVETLTEQLNMNQEAIAILKRQLHILKGQWKMSTTYQHQTEESLFMQEYQMLKDENDALNALVNAYEHAMHEILFKLRAYIHDTTQQTLHLHQHYREQLLHQQKSYLDLQAGLYQLNGFIQQAYTASMLQESEMNESSVEHHQI